MDYCEKEVVMSIFSNVILRTCLKKRAMKIFSFVRVIITEEEEEEEEGDRERVGRVNQPLIMVKQ